MPELPLCRRRGSLPGSPPFFPASPTPGGPTLPADGIFPPTWRGIRLCPWGGSSSSPTVPRAGPIGWNTPDRRLREDEASRNDKPTPHAGYGKARAHVRFFMRRKKAGRRCPAFCVRAVTTPHGPAEKPLTPGVRIRRSMSTRSSLSRSKSPSISKISSPGVIGLPGPVRLMMAV